MPAELLFTDDEGVIFRARGVVTGEDIIAASRELYADPRFAGLRYQIIDRSECTSYEVTSADVAAVAELDRVAAYHNPGMRVAIVATDARQDGMSRIYADRLGPGAFITRVFTDRAAAEAWARQRNA